MVQTPAGRQSLRPGPLAIPVVADLPFGHVRPNSTLPCEVCARLDAHGASLTVLESAVSA